MPPDPGRVGPGASWRRSRDGYLWRMDINALGAVELSDADGATHELASFWADRPVIVVFLRHFG